MNDDQMLSEFGTQLLLPLLRSQENWKDGMGSKIGTQKL